jgi:hypothetical protein
MPSSPQTLHEPSQRAANLNTVTYVFLLCAIIAAIASALGRAPVWLSQVLLCVVVALIVLPK